MDPKIVLIFLALVTLFTSTMAYDEGQSKMGQQVVWLSLMIVMLYVGLSSAQKAKCEKRPTVTGSCKNYKIKWFFSSSLKECIMFHWGGCNHTENIFDNGEDCEAQCMGLGEVKSAV
ncbi:hypothetical protein M5D96_004250 [Drosophila gunungcola]|uniref:BPTI/Kunitz inhibitor domain-containing protein n=1 Tax=Drosophila gunungcola TaxID=103775 RepID=A0A9P9YTR6_9MUSC|nr:hypothetical protein M5D96_004250 [Drosophila gunungcola]